MYLSFMACELIDNTVFICFHACVINVYFLHLDVKLHGGKADVDEFLVHGT